MRGRNGFLFLMEAPSLHWKLTICYCSKNRKWFQEKRYNFTFSQTVSPISVPIQSQVKLWLISSFHRVLRPISLFSGITNCLNKEDCIGLNRICHRNGSMSEGLCVCQSGFVETNDSIIKCQRNGTLHRKSLWRRELIHIFFRNINLLK